MIFVLNHNAWWASAVFLGNSNYRRIVINPANQKGFWGLLKWLVGWYMLATACPNGRLQNCLSLHPALEQNYQIDWSNFLCYYLILWSSHFYTPLHHYFEFIFQPNFSTCIPVKITICIIVFESQSRGNKGNLKHQTKQFSNTRIIFSYSKCSRPLPQF